MRNFLIPVLAFGCIGASEKVEQVVPELETPRQQSGLAPSEGISAMDQLLAAEDTVIIGDGEAEKRQEYLRSICRDRIAKAREDYGQPPLLKREPASPERPLAIYAVDRREEGCGVIVMMGDTTDIRPVPEQPKGSRIMWPAQPGQ